MVNSRGASSVTGSRRWLWYNKRSCGLSATSDLPSKTDPAACLQEKKTCLQKNLPSIHPPPKFNRRRNKTKTNIHSGIELTEQRQDIFVSERALSPFPPLPSHPHPPLPNSPAPQLSKRGQVITRAFQHTEGIHHLKPLVLGPYDLHARFFVRLQFA